MILLAAVAAIHLAPIPSNPPQKAGECTWVHGRYFVANGSSVRRVWIIGTRRIIALFDDDDDIPSSVRRYEQANPGGGGDLLYGDFHVCAVEPSRPGLMQHVRLTAARHLIFRGKAF